MGKMIKCLFKQTYPSFYAQGYNTRSHSIPHHPPSPTPSISLSNTETSTLPSYTPPKTHYSHPQNSPNFQLSSGNITHAEARAILNVDVNTSRREILLKFEILSCKYHPDK